MECPQTFLSIAPPGIYIVSVDRCTTLVQVLMKMSGVLDDEQDCHTTAVAVTVSWAFSDVGDWMMNPLSTRTACTAIVNSSQRSTCLKYLYRDRFILRLEHTTRLLGRPRSDPAPQAVTERATLTSRQMVGKW